MKWFFLLIFVVSTTIHLYASKKRDVALRAKSKPFILLTLIGLYGFSSADVRWVVIAALFFSWLGDVFFIKSGITWFTAGGIAFMVSHGFFVASYCKDINFFSIPVVAIVLIAVPFATAVTYIFYKLKPHIPKSLFYPMFLYLLINGTMNCFAIYRALSCTNIRTVTTCIGAFLFFVSDTSLFFLRFNRESKQKTHFLVMLTYSIGELLIVLGLI